MTEPDHDRRPADCLWHAVGRCANPGCGYHGAKCTRPDICRHWILRSSVPAPEPPFGRWSAGGEEPEAETTTGNDYGIGAGTDTTPIQPKRAQAKRLGIPPIEECVDIDLGPDITPEPEAAEPTIKRLGEYGVVHTDGSWEAYGSVIQRQHKHIATLTEELRELKEWQTPVLEGAITDSPAGEDEGDWYCPNCGYLSWSRVTYHETCDTCHEPVMWHSARTRDIVEEQAQTIAALTSEVERLRDALEWYADEKNYEGDAPMYRTVTAYGTGILYDRGWCARRALSEKGEKDASPA
jgi:hypothetical protein